MLTLAPHLAPAWAAAPAAAEILWHVFSAMEIRFLPVLCAAYAPDFSRGLVCRADLWSHLDASLSAWRASHPTADVVLGMDSNTWLTELDCSRRGSPDANGLRAILATHGLLLASPSGIAMHRSGTVIDIVAVFWLSRS